ncbi:MAG: DNA primase [Cytophagales bacterium]|nr:DNA primase [Rhizobacter sp.]
MIPPAFVQDLLSRTDIVEVIGRHVQLKKAGINHKGLCPFHGEKSPSFIVSATRQTYHCFGCGVHGNAIGFLMEHSGMGFLDAVRDLAQQTGLTVPEDDRSPQERERAAELKERQATLSDVLAKAAEHYRKQLKASPRAVEYLKGRGLTGEIAAAFGLGYSPDGWRGLASVFPHYDDPLLEESGLVIASGETDAEKKRYDRFRDRIMFPIRSVPGDVIGFGGRVLDKGEPKYLNSPETPVFIKGRELYGLHEARAAMRQKGYVLVVEGYMDVVALAQLGFPNAVATLGTACTAEHVHKLFRFTDSVVFSFDGDAAGRRAAGRALEASLPHATDTRTIRFLFLPTEHDPDSYVREHGTEAFEQCVAQAVPLSRQLIEAARDGMDIDSAEGRAKLLANAKPLWAALPEGALKLQLLSELAQAGGLATPDLAQLWQTATAPRRAPDASEPSRRGPATFSRGSMPSRPNRMSNRAAPASKEDTAVRMLLLHSEWWQQLDANDHELLAGLPTPLGPLCAWLERHLNDHGTTPWAVLEQALQETEWGEAVLRLVPQSVLADEMQFTELRGVIDSMWIESLKAQQKLLIQQAGTDPGALIRWRELEDRIRLLAISNQPTLT